jgi:hypothetical protein
MIPELTTPTKTKKELPFLTKEAKAIYDKTVQKIESYFSHPQTKEILQRFIHIQNTETKTKILTQLNTINTEFANNPIFLTKKQITKALPYAVIVMTENEEIYEQLKKSNILVQLISNKTNMDFILDYDIVQAIECDSCAYTLDKYDNILNYKDIELIHPESYLKKLNEYEESLTQLMQHFPQILAQNNTELQTTLNILKEYNGTTVTTIKADTILNEINTKIEQKLTLTSISAFELLHHKNKNSLPQVVTDIIEEILAETQIPAQCFTYTVPVEMHKDKFKLYQKEQELQQFLKIAKLIQKNAHIIVKTQKYLEQIHINTLIIDFAKAIDTFHKEFNAKPIKDNTNNELKIHKSQNPHLKNPQAIDYELCDTYPAALLTGANSGGKTTLLEHILTLCALKEIGLYANGDISLPNYGAIYYFAKNKGSTNKGAFETMLMQLAKIQTNTNTKTLVLADEMESVTEPSVAAKVMAKTIDYFISQNCQCIFATHLGGILQNHIAKNVRIDGIQAIGFDENDNILIDHNPALHTLAASTPELIIQKLAKQHKDEFLLQLAKAI